VARKILRDAQRYNTPIFVQIVSFLYRFSRPTCGSKQV
jgi:hypothetical protein